MEQRDYLKKQIDQFAEALAKLLSDLSLLKKENERSEFIELTNQTLKAQMDQDLEELLSISDETFVNILKTKKIKNEGLDKLAEVLLFIADKEEPVEAKRLYKKSLLLFEKLESVEPIYSMDRHRKIERIKKILA